MRFWKNIVIMKNQTVNVKIPALKEVGYPIIIGENLLENTGEFIKKYTKANKLAVVTNSTVYDLFGEKVKKNFENSGFNVKFIILEDGEKYKNIKSLNKIWDEVLEFKLERKDALVALGGGVIGDIAGFAAASYLRGIDFIQIPTTLLAQVDSSVGGKVAINHPLGKNMIGAFYQPKLVLSDIKTLESLPLEQLKTGLAEVLKYSFIEKTCGLNEDFETNFLEYLKQNKDSIFALDSDVMVKIIEYSCKLKAAVVNQDEKELGLRAILNFGHTIGHAIEKCTEYKKFTHGQAVAIGMKGVFELSKKTELINKDYFDCAKSLLEQYEMDYKIPDSITEKELMSAMYHDKKVNAGKVRFVMPIAYGEVGIFDDINFDLLESVLKTL